MTASRPTGRSLCHGVGHDTRRPVGESDTPFTEGGLGDSRCRGSRRILNNQIVFPPVPSQSDVITGISCDNVDPLLTSS